jgi:DNA-binding MarR family transcriptional regulator
MLPTPRNPEVRFALEKLLRALQVFRSDDRDMPIGEAVSFLFIALGETPTGGGISVTDVSKQGDFSLASASRHAQALGLMDRHQRPGLAWVSDAVDPMERRKKVLRLTDEGRLAVAELVTALKV